MPARHRHCLALVAALACGGESQGRAGTEGACGSTRERADLAAQAEQDDQVDDDARRRRWERLLAAHRACGDLAAEASAMGAWSAQAMRRLARDEALSIENARYALAVRAGLDYQRAESAARLGIALTTRGETDPGGRRLREAAGIFESLGAWSEAADARSRLARMSRMAGDYLAALTDEQAALDLRRRIDPPPNVWRSLLNLAVLYEQLELPADSRRRYAESLEEAERAGDDASIATVLAGYSGFLNDFGAADAAQALAMAQRALDIARRIGDTLQTVSALLQSGRALSNLGRLDDAGRAYEEALAQARAIAHEGMQAHILLRFGELAHLQGDPTLALQRVEQARLLYEQQNNRHRLVKVHAALEQIHAALGDPLSAALAGRERFRLRDELVGAKATGKLGELLAQFEIGEERRRSERLAQENAVAELRLAAERQQLRLIYLVAAAIGTALLLLGWRHATARRLYRLLHQQNERVVAQSTALQQANRQLSEQSERLYRASTTDSLTGVANRAQGMQRLQALTHASPPGARPAVLLIDVDHFKSINDRHGHPVGDQVLATTAQALQQALPPGGELSRVGGEEFMVLLPDADGRKAFDVGNALRAQVRATGIRGSTQTIGVTISVGICALAETPGLNAHQAYAHADAALYRAKRGGRDCVCMHGMAGSGLTVE